MDKILRSEVIFWVKASNNGSGLQLKVIESIGTESDGLFVARRLQGFRRKGDFTDVDFKQVFSSFQVDGFIKFINRVIWHDFRFKFVLLSAVGNVL